MSFQNSVGWTSVTNTGTIFGTNAVGGTAIHGYSLKGSGAVAAIDVNDNGSYIFTIPALTAAGATTNMFPVGVKFVGPVTLSGVSTNLTGLTLFYNREA